MSREKVLLQGHITEIKHITKSDDVEWVEFSYEFEYTGVQFQGKDVISADYPWDKPFEVGMPLEICFFTDTQKWKLNMKRVVKAKDGEKLNIFTKIAVILLGTGILMAMMKIVSGIIFAGIAAYFVGIGEMYKEIVFNKEKGTDKYIKINGYLVDYKHHVKYSDGRRSSTYHKVYRYIEDGMEKRYESKNGFSKKNGNIGDTVILYKNKDTNQIREDGSIASTVLTFVFVVIVGSIFIFFGVMALKAGL